MKNFKLLASLLFLSLTVFSCTDDPDPVNEEEVITTMTVTLSANAVGTPVELKYVDLDGDGPNAPVITVSGDLASETVYNGSIVLLNETESPAENITEEVEEEDDEHQFFYTVGAGLDAAVEYGNFDGNLNPLGTEFLLSTGAAGSGTLTFTLRHEPKKPNDGLSDAGGSTDISATFALTVQ